MHALIIICAKYLIYIAALAAGLYWLTRPTKQKIDLIIFGLITAVVAYALAKLGGALYYDPRPFITDHVAPLFAHSNDNGFPSDHTLASSVIAITIYTASKKWGIALGVVALLIGGARVLAHVHHPIDIIGSLIFALIGGVVAYYLSPKLVARFSKTGNPSHDAQG